jgi:PAS domain S-box-containing protein
MARRTPRPPSRELQHRLLFEHNPLPMMVFERATLRILAVSNAAVASYGYSRAEFLKMTLRDLTPPEDLAWLESLETSRRGENIGQQSRRARHVLSDGSIIDVENTGDDLVLAGRRCRIVLCQNVTERNRATVELAEAREQLRKSAEEYRLLFERNPQPLLAYDCETLRVVAVSDASIASSGYSREEFLEMTLLDFAPEQDHETMREYARANVRAKRLGLQLARPRRQLNKDGTLIDIEVTSDDLTLGGRRCRVCLSIDVTERNRASAALAIARDEAVEASNMKSAFLANMSHEIRTPMNGVIGLTEMLLEMNLDSEQRECAEQIARSGEQMLAIVNDILDISKIETGHLELDIGDFDLHETIGGTCAVTRVQAAAKGLRLDLEIDAAVPRLVRGDSRRLHQVVLNLVANAVKFTSSGAVTVRVKATHKPKAGEVIRIEVADSGIGIEPTRLQHMFEPFTQADASTTRNYGGTGLGLAIARELVELMGGTIGADSVPGAGSTFWFELQLAAPVSSAAQPAETGSAATTPAWASSPLVLVAEDSPINQIVAARALERCGCRAQVVGDGREALEALQAQVYDAVLMDCQMPGVDGYDATRELRRSEHGADHTPVIAMTAQAMDGDRERCLAAGMDDYISKPLRHLALAEALRRWIPPTPKTGQVAKPVRAA